MPTTRTNKLLPAIFQTETNKKFLNATLDQLTTDTALKEINGYIGRKFAPGFAGIDTYIKEPTLSRADYQLEPTVVYKNLVTNKVEFASTYPETLQTLSYLGANVANQDNLWTSEYYTYDPKINLDPLINFSQYYWLPGGPDTVTVSAGNVQLEQTYTITYQSANKVYNIFGYGTLSNPDLVLARGGTYTFNVNQSGHGFYIQTEPGLTGKQITNENLSTRQILGVADNGAETGSVVFTVPVKTAQDNFIAMPTVQIVDFVTMQTYAQLQGQLLSAIVENYGGLDGQAINLDGKFVIFGTYTTNSSDWTVGMTTVPVNDRYGIWQISLTPSGDDFIVDFTHYDDIPTNNKVYIRSGLTKSNTEWYKTVSGSLQQIPVITANRDFLYYQDSKDEMAFGRIRLIDADSPNIDVDADIIGQSNYISPNGIIFTNGLKVKFDNTAIPSSYQNKTYYVDGVGQSIILTDAELLDLETIDKTNYKVNENYSAAASATLSFDSKSFTINTTDFPDGQTILRGVFPNSNADLYIIEQNASVTYPYRAGTNSPGEHEAVTLRSGLIGISLPGIYLYAPYDNLNVDGLNGSKWHLNGPEVKINGQDIYGGTPKYRYDYETLKTFTDETEQNSYYYQDSNFITANAWGNVSGFNNGSYTHSDGHSKIIGFAADGYPIYGPYGYTVPLDPSTPIKRMISSYTLSVNSTNRPAGIVATVKETVTNSNIINVDIWNLRAGMRITVNSAGLTPSTVYITNTFSDILQLNPELTNIDYYNPSAITLNQPVSVTEGDTLTFEFLPGAFIEDYTYMPGYGTLDRFNGRFCVTPDFPNGTYAYFATQDISGNPVYPYFVGDAFYGSLTPDSSLNIDEIDYITISRASRDLNPWTVRNQWFHQKVIEVSAAYNNKAAIFSSDQRAKRPIIEFLPDFQLYDFGKIGLPPVDFYDTSVRNPLQSVEGKLGYYADGKYLFDGAKIVFPNATDLSVRNKIFQVQFINPLETIPYIHLEEYQMVVANNTINVKSGIKNGEKSFYFNGTIWKTGQQKLQTNQSPYFDVLDTADISFGSTTKYPIAASDTKFIGTKIFNYKLNDLSRTDPILGLPISYKSIVNIGDIEFSNYYDTDTFSYIENNSPVIRKVNTGFIYKNNPDGSITKFNVWTKCLENSKQYQLLSFNFDGISNIFTLDIIPEPSINVPNIKVFVNYTEIPVGKFYIYDAPNNQISVRIDPELLKENDRVDIQVYSAEVSKAGFYQVPNNLNYNSQNEVIESLTLGSLRNHVNQLIQNSTEFFGPFPGVSNLRDINIVNRGGTILQQSAPTIYSTLFLNNNNYNFVSSVLYAQQEYTRFKNKFLNLAVTLGNVELDSIVDSVDILLKKLNAVKNNTFPWYYSDLIPYGDNKNVITYTVFDTLQKNYELTNIFTLENPSNKAVLVYLNGQQLYYGIDYTFQSSIPAITLQDSLNVSIDDVITIVEYLNTDGCYVPETPTKLGLYPKFNPEIFTDSSYSEPQQFIRGHDGSLTPIFGDFRDNLLLELETRIFNNIKNEYNEKIINIYDVIPGKFRDTGISLNEYNSLLARSYLQWAGNNNLDYVTNNVYRLDDTFTYNYSTSQEKDSQQKLPGSWRSCYRYYYDTENPNTRPWEMLGFTIEPDWWQSTYGPAPYTSGNTLLWEDLAAGRIRQGTRQGIDNNFVRSNLLNFIPVDAYGNLVSPLGLLTEDFTTNFDTNWSIGQLGPTELAWTNSSEYPYALQIVLGALKPAKYFSLGLIKNKYTYSTVLDQYLVTDTNYRLQPKDIEVNGYVDSTGNVSRMSGYLNWISDYQTANGILDKKPLLDYVQNFNVNLGYRAAGFTSKEYLKVLAEQFSPNSINDSIIIPDSDYDIVLHKSSPLTKLRYSAVIIERTEGGFKISGYDTNSPYFTLNPPNVNGSVDTISVLNRSVLYYNTGLDSRINITYGTVLETVQQVVSFISGYSFFLQKQGFIFNYFDQNLGKIRDWKLSVEEFLFWVQQGWKAGTTIVLSPFADRLTYFYPTAIIDEVKGAFNDSRILNQNFLTLGTDAYTVSRDNNTFSVTLNSTSSKLIGLADLKLVQYEHLIIFKNTTQFNDVIYEPQSGARQFRLRLVGTKTAEWQGAVYAPGFIYSNGIVNAWQANKDYLKSDIVEYKNFFYSAKSNVTGSTKFNFADWLPIAKDQIKEGLIKTFAYNAGIFEDFYDINTINLESEFDLYSLSLIGYKNRSYLRNVGLNDSTQVKLYQGFIKEKGTKKVTEVFKNITIGSGNKDLELSEDWAFRVGSYGSLDTNQFIEINLNEDYVVSNPSSIEVNNSSAVTFNSLDTVNDNIYKTSSVTWQPPIFRLRNNNSSYTDDIQTPGYVNLEDIDFTAFDLSNPVELIDRIYEIGVGKKIWVAKDFNQDWNVYTVSRTATGASVIAITRDLNNLNNTSQFLITTNRPHFLNEGDVAFIVPNSSDNAFLASVYRVTAINDLTSFVAVANIDSGNINLYSTTSVSASLYTLVSTRLDYASQLNEFTPTWQPNSKIWIDNFDSSGWAVYNKTEPWQSDLKLTQNPDQAGSKFGHSIATSKDENFIIVGIPGYDNNEGGFVTLSANNTNYISENTLSRSAVVNVANFGTSITAGTLFYAVSAPGTNSNVGHVEVYSKDFLGTSQITKVLYPNTTDPIKFGYSISMSQDDQWLYVGAPDGDEVYVYQFVSNIESNVENLIVNGSDTEYTLPFIPYSSDSILVSNVSSGLLRHLLPYYDYQIVGDKIQFTVAPEAGGVTIQQGPGFIFANTISGFSASSKAGFSVASSINGRQVVIGEPENNVTVNGDTFNKAGTISVYDRSVERFLANGLSDTFTTLYPITANNKVYINNEITNANNYSIVGTNQVVFVDIPVENSLIEIETNYFNKIQTFNANIIEAGQNFGYSVDMCISSCSLYAGAPYQTNPISGAYNSGAVYTFINQSRSYGTITGSVENANVTIGDSIRVNDFVVTFSGNSYITVIDDINNANIPGVLASNINNKVRITSNSKLTTDLLRVLPGEGTGLEDLGLDVFVLTQYIPHPKNKSYEYFGQKVRRTYDSSVLSISSKDASSELRMTFDESGELESTTTLDADSTRFIDPGNGAAWIYNYLPDSRNEIDHPGQFVFSQELLPFKENGSSFLLAFSKFGSDIAVTSRYALVGAEDDVYQNSATGRIYKFINETGLLGWDIIRQYSSKVDIESIVKAYIYSLKSSNILYYLDYIDPAKGKVLGAAEQDITYKTDYDPAIYNRGTITLDPNYQETFYWNEMQVGQVWWDLSTLRYVDYEQGSIKYRLNNWGAVFPGSSIDVYEWVESIYPPSQYQLNGGNGQPKNPDNSAYVEISYVDSGTNTPIVKYYFWVKNKTSLDANQQNRSLPVATIANYIRDPKTSGIKYFAALAPDAVGVYNVNKDLSAKDRVFHLDYTTDYTQNIIHNEYQLVSEKEKTAASLPNSILNKIKDSLSRTDDNGNVVPDIDLKPQNKYGISNIPRQSIFINQINAIKELVLYTNNIFAKNLMSEGFDLSGISSSENIPIAGTGAYDLQVNTYEELLYLPVRSYPVGYKVLVLNDSTIAGLWAIYSKLSNDTWKLIRVQSYDTSEYWEYIDWYAEGFNNTIQPTYTVETIVDIARLNLQSEDIVKINNTGQGKWSIIQIWPTFISTVAIQDGTIKLKDSLYNMPEYFMGFSNERFSIDRFDHNPNIEIRYIFEALKNNLLVNQLSQEFVNLFFVLIKYALTEQKSLDWVFKTSLVRLNQITNNLGQPKIYNKQSQTLFEEYFKEVKPFRTLIREFIDSYKVNDNLQGYVSDFDVPATFDPVLRLYRSPSNEYSQDQELLQQPQYFDWVNSYTYYVNDFIIENGGTGYTSAPTITITGSQIDDDARAVATLTNGVVTKITLIYPGSNYITQPTVTLSGGGGSGASVYALLANPVTRKIKTTLAYDRITYSSSALEWEPNTTYNIDDIVVYNNNAYKVNFSFTTGSNFSSEISPDGRLNPLILLPQNALSTANDRIAAYYSPTEYMPAKVYSFLQTGINYPSIIVEGKKFEESAGFDVIDFDNNVFDSIDFDEYGTPIVPESQLDSIIESEYTDPYLGLDPEDILIDGAQYVDTNNSYGPEELVPGRVFDTLDMTVTTFATNAVDSSYNTWLSTTAFYVYSINLIDGGEGYPANSTLTLVFTGGGGTGASGTAATNSDGTIISISLNNSGSGFTSIPNVTVTDSNTSVAVMTVQLAQDTYDTFSYRIFKDKNDNYQYLRVLDDSNTTLASSVGLTDNTITVANSAVLPMPAPNSSVICSVTINGERIIYFSKNDATNTLSNLIRGAYGTGANTHAIGTDVIDSSYTQIVPTSSNYTWTPNVDTVLMSMSREFNTFYANTAYIRSNAWIDVGVMEPITSELGLTLITEDDDTMVTEESKYAAVTGLYGSSKVPAIFVRQI